MKQIIWILILKLLGANLIISQSNEDFWKPIDLEFDAMNLRSSVLTKDNILMAVGEYGTIIRTQDKISFNVVNGDFKYNHLNDIDYSKNEMFLAVGNNSLILFSNDNGFTWGQIKNDINENLLSVRYFQDYFYFNSTSSIYKFSLQDKNIEKIDIGFKGISKLYKTDDDLYCIGEDGLLAKLDDDKFTKIDLGIDNDITEIIHREKNIIVFPLSGKPIISNDKFQSFNDIEQNNTLYRIHNAAWINEDIIVALANDSGVGGLQHIYSSDQGKSWNIGSYPWPPIGSLKGFGNQVVITGERAAIIVIDDNYSFNESFGFFDTFVHLGEKSKQYPILNIKEDKLVAISSQVDLIDINTFKRENLIDEPLINDILIVEDTIFYIKDKEYYEGGRNYYESYVIKKHENKIDTLISIEKSLLKLEEIQKIDDKIIVFGNRDKIYIKHDNEEDFEEVLLDYNIIELKFENSVMHCIIADMNYDNYFYAYSNDFGQTFSNLVNLPSTGFLSVSGDKVYYLHYFSEGQNVRNTIYQITDTITEISTINILHFYLRYLYTYNNFILLGGKDSIYTSYDNGSTWQSEYLQQYATIIDLAGHKYKIFISLNKNIYHKEYSPISSRYEQKYESDIIIYPNPATSVITISNIEPGTVYKIYNTLGIEVLSGIYNENINVANLLSGIYFIQLPSTGETLKFVRA